MSDIKNQALNSLGQIFITGFSGKALSDETSAFLSQAKIGGVIYFSHNYESPAQIAELTNEIQSTNRETPLWISIDQEGGRVQRFKAPFTLIPSAEKIALKNSPKLTFEVGEMMAKELKAVGVNLNFCPVADILTNPKNKVIGDRAYGKTADEVTRYVSAIARGHVTQGVQPCCKHFPGHGDTLLDSHEELPIMETPLERLKDNEIKPFMKFFKSRGNMVMVAHILNKSIDPIFPASLSEKTIQGLLRKEIRYSKLIVSDDLEMKALTNQYTPEDIPVLALKAGCDILIYRSEEASRHAYSTLQKAIETGALDPQIVLTASQRILTIKNEVLEPFETIKTQHLDQIIGIESHQELVKNFTS
jgi:beta-N-acetylhexosaminidase